MAASGRLAACFMESMATLGIAAYGYGIRYEHGLFRQVIEHGIQQELPEEWLRFGNPWEFERPEVAYPIGFGGAVLARQEDGRTTYAWHPAERLDAIAYDTPVIGGPASAAPDAPHHANTLRLWSARAATPLHLDAFNRGDHVGALQDRVRTEAVSRVLYPGDDSEAGQELRLRQEFFFASASLQDLLRRHMEQFGTLTNLADKVAIQLNDTHPAIAVIELMRLLMDVHGMAWGRGLDRDRGLHRLYQPHLAARGARDLARLVDGAAAAAAHADHLSAERPPPGTRALQRSGRRSAAVRRLVDR